MDRFMNKRVLMIIISGLLIAHLDAPPVFSQTKQTIANKILYQLSTSSFLAKDQWQFLFTDNYCTFNKYKQFKEKDGALSSSYNIKIALDKVNIQPEKKRYDTFFICKEAKKCIEETWNDKDGKVTDIKMLDSTSFYIQPPKLADEVFNRMKYLYTLCDRSIYTGPSGLKWGQTIDGVTEELKKRFKLFESKTVRNGTLFEQKFGSRFAGFETNKIHVRYVDGKFYEMMVILDVNENESITRKWYDVVKKIVEKYGKPNNVVLPKAADSIDDLMNPKIFKDLGVFDLEIKSSNWNPAANWIYQNKAIISVESYLNIKKWEIHWQFVHTELEKQAKIRIEENPVEDF